MILLTIEFPWVRVSALACECWLLKLDRFSLMSAVLSLVRPTPSPRCIPPNKPLVLRYILQSAYETWHQCVFIVKVSLCITPHDIFKYKYFHWTKDSSSSFSSANLRRSLEIFKTWIPRDGIAIHSVPHHRLLSWYIRWSASFWFRDVTSIHIRWLSS